MSATYDYQCVNKFYPDGNFNCYYAKMERKMDVNDLIIESNYNAIKGTVIKNITDKEGLHNWLVYFQMKQKMCLFADTLKQVGSIDIFELFLRYTVDEVIEKYQNKHLHFEYYSDTRKKYIEECFSFAKELFEKRENVTILATKKLDVGTDLNPEYPVGVAILGERESATIIQFGNRCRKNIKMVIVQANLHTEAQGYFFENYWQNTFKHSAPCIEPETLKKVKENVKTLKEIEPGSENQIESE